jgi:hypothetical protein
LSSLQDYAVLKTQIKELTAMADELKGEIGAMREEAGVTSLGLEGFKVTQVTNTRTVLDKALLMENGVSPAQIENSTISKPGKSYTKVTCPGDRDYDDAV